MSESLMLSVMSGLFLTLGGLLTWIGKRIFMRLDDLMDGLGVAREDHLKAMAAMEKDFAHELIEIHKTMKLGDDELHSRVTSVCSRVSKIEAVCQVQHKGVQL